MFEFKEVTKKFQGDLLKGSKEFLALDRLSFALTPGTLTGFLGANGAGKTTSLKCLFKFINLSSGEISFTGELGNSWGEIKSNIGYVPERPYFYPYLTGREFVYLCGELNDVKKEQIKQKIGQWAERLGIEFALDRKLNGYSKGMLQRLGVLTSLVHDPLLVILDEPLSGLDPLGRLELKKAFIDLQKMGKTIFFSSHIVSDVEEVCDHVTVIDAGKLVYAGSTKNILQAKENEIFEVFCLCEKKNFTEELLRNLERHVSGGCYFKVHENEINQFLTKAKSEGLNIQKIEREKVTLEEFVYHTSEKIQVMEREERS